MRKDETWNTREREWTIYGTAGNIRRTYFFAFQNNFVKRPWGKRFRCLSVQRFVSSLKTLRGYAHASPTKAIRSFENDSGTLPWRCAAPRNLSTFTRSLTRKPPFPFPIYVHPFEPPENRFAHRPFYNLHRLILVQRPSFESKFFFRTERFLLYANSSRVKPFVIARFEFRTQKRRPICVGRTCTITRLARETENKEKREEWNRW